MRIIKDGLCFLILFLAGQHLVAQLSASDSLVPVDVNYRFVEGVYTDVEALKRNEPTHVLANLGGNLVVQEDEYLLKVEHLHLRGRPDLRLQLADLKVICVKGLPYVQAYQDTLRQFTVYAGLRVRGRLSYYAYEQQRPDTFLVKAYNPLTGRPFRQQNVIREKSYLMEKVLNLETEKVHDFDLDNMLELLATDEALVKSLRQLSPAEATARLQRCLLIFDDRHPFLLPWVKEEEEETN